MYDPIKRTAVYLEGRKVVSFLEAREDMVVGRLLEQEHFDIQFHSEDVGEVAVFSAKR